MRGYYTRIWIQELLGDHLESWLSTVCLLAPLFHAKHTHSLLRPPKVSSHWRGTAPVSFLGALLLNQNTLWGMMLNLYEVFIIDSTVSFIFMYSMFSFKCFGFYLSPEAISNEVIPEIFLSFFFNVSLFSHILSKVARWSQVAPSTPYLEISLARSLRSLDTFTTFLLPQATLLLTFLPLYNKDHRFSSFQ